MNVEARKQALHYFFERIVQPLGYKFTPDADLMDFLLEQEIALEQKHGIPFCPCQGLRHERTRGHADRLPLHPLPPRALRRDEAVLVRAVRASGRDRSGQLAADTGKGVGS